MKKNLVFLALLVAMCTSIAGAQTPYLVGFLPNPTATVSGTTNICAGNSAQVTITLHGGSSWSFTWTDGTSQYLVNTADSTYELTVSPTQTTAYWVISVTNNWGCSAPGTGVAIIYVDPLPLAFNVSTPNIHFCQGMGGTLTLSGSEVGITYQVKNGAINVGSPMMGTGAALSFPGITIAGVPLTVYAVNPATTCSRWMNGSVSFIQDPLPATAGTITGPTTICAGVPVTYFISPIPDATGYVWSVPNGATITAGQGTTSITVVGTTSVTGDVAVFGSNACGLGQPNSLTITINPKPVAGIFSTPDPPNICSGESIGLVATGGNDATWYPGGFSGLSYDPTPTGNTTYTAIVFNTSGCSDTATIYVTVSPSPVVSVSVTPFGGEICQGQSATMTASGANTYVWSGGGNLYTLPAYTVTPNSTTTYTVVGTTGNCDASTTVTITVHPNPAPTITSNPDPATICNSDQVTLTANAGPGMNYEWNSGQFTAQIIATPASTTTYVVTATDAYTCSGSASLTVNVNPNPVATATSNSPVCAGDGIQLNGSSTIAGSYSWSGPGFTSSAQNPTILNSNTGMSGIYTVTVTTNAGCVGIATTQVTVNNPPTISVAASDTVVCQLESVMLMAVIYPTGTTVTWAGPNGWTSTNQNPTVNNPVSGAYVATASFGGCSVYESINIMVNPLPSVVFYTPGTGYFQNTDSAVQLTADPPGGTFSGMGVFGGYFYPMIAGNGNWVLTYEYTDGNGCSNSATQTVIVGPTGIEEATENGISIYPNPTDGVLNITGDIDILEIQMYDVNGQMVYSGTERTIDMSTYSTGMYFIKIASADGNVFSAKVLKN